MSQALWRSCLAVVFPLIAVVAMVVPGFVSLPVAIVFPLVVLALVMLTILPTLFVVFVFRIATLFPIVMILGLWLIVVILGNGRNCCSASKRHDEC